MPSITKSYILDQYAYDDEDAAHPPTTQSYISDYVGGTVIDRNEERKTLRAFFGNDEDNGLLLSELQYRQSEDEKILANEASLYVMSKADVKALKLQVKKRRQEIDILTKKKDNIKRQVNTEKQLPKEEDAESCEDLTGGLFNLNFSPTPSVPTIDISPSKEATGKVTDVCPTIPSSWIGTKPSDQLRQYCRRKKLSSPTFANIPSIGCKLRIKSGKSEVVNIVVSKEESINCPTTSAAREYAATKALYELECRVVSNDGSSSFVRASNRYQLLPPDHAKLWQQWTKDDIKALEVLAKETTKMNEDEVGAIVEQVFKFASSRTNNSSSPERDIVQDEVKNNDIDIIPEEWDALSESSSPSLTYIDSKLLSKTRYSEIPSTDNANDSIDFKSIPSVITRTRQNLPMYSHRNDIITAIRDNPVVCIRGETGCGKTTQCGQYILEAFDSTNANIVCTQPRRISAMSVAERVAEERNERCGHTIGYAVKLEQCFSKKHTKLLFCTTGVLLRRMQSDNEEDAALQGVTHIVIDEVHERQWQVDVLLVLLRNLMNSTRPDLKLVLMSATMDERVMTDFFCQMNPPLLHIPGRTFKVNSYFLEDIMEATKFIIEEDSPYAKQRSRDHSSSMSMTIGRGEHRSRNIRVEYPEDEDALLGDEYISYSLGTRRSMHRVNEMIVNYELIECTLSFLLRDESLSLPNSSICFPDGVSKSTNGSTLVFLPGLGEIQTLVNRLRGDRFFGDSNQFDIIPLHSTISSKDQRRAFASTPGKRKIIISTNIAETSITIPDVVYVIDSGLVREVRTDKRTSTQALVTDWCSHASAKQRQGRAGRVQPGICLKLYSTYTFHHVMKPQTMPELQRVPLEEICLTVLGSGFQRTNGMKKLTCWEFLRQAPQPPNEDAVKASLKTLIDVGAVDVLSSNNENSMEEEKLTNLGIHLSKLPIHVRLGKMLIYSVVFKCLNPIMTICAALSTKSLFSSNNNISRDAACAKAAHRKFRHINSDFISICSAWEGFQTQKEKSIEAAKIFCRKNYFDYKTMIEISELRQHFFNILAQIGFVDEEDWNENVKISNKYNVHSAKEAVVSAVVVAGLYPNVAQITSHSNLSLQHMKESLQFHNSSVNYKNNDLKNDWVAFFEKFKVNKKTTVAVTCAINPYSILMFGKNVRIEYLQREAVVDGWIRIGVAAKTGILFRELRNKIRVVLGLMINAKESNHIVNECEELIEGIIGLLTL